MIRSLGSSLLAKAGTGSLSRKNIETRITKPEIPGKGAVGTARRELTEQTDITPTAPGSEKIIRSAPGIESASLPGIAANQVPIMAGIGSPGGAPQMFSGRGLMTGGSPASQPGAAGRQASAIATMAAPSGQVAGARSERAAQMGQVSPEGGASTQYQAPGSPNYSVGSFFPGIASLGGRVSAEGEGNVEIPKNFGQAVVATLSKPGSKGEAWGTNPAVTRSGVGSLTKPSKTVKAIGSNISSALRSVTQQVKNTVSKLRSKLFGK